MVLKPVLEAIDIRFRKVQPALCAVPMLAFLLQHDRLLCCLEATACGVLQRSERLASRQGRLSTKVGAVWAESAHLTRRRHLSCACRILAVAASAHRPVLRVLTGEA